MRAACGAHGMATFCPVMFEMSLLVIILVEYTFNH